jgi:hypothetical protein
MEHLGGMTEGYKILLGKHEARETAGEYAIDGRKILK